VSLSQDPYKIKWLLSRLKATADISIRKWPAVLSE